MILNWNWLLIVCGALLVLIEVAAGGFAGFDFVLLGSALMLGGALGLGLRNPLAGVLVAAVLCVAYIALGRRWMRKRMQVRPTASNVDALIGQRALVTQPLAEHSPGQVRVRDEVWRAVPAAGANGPFTAGTVVTVEGVEGVTLQVR